MTSTTPGTSPATVKAFPASDRRLLGNVAAPKAARNLRLAGGVDAHHGVGGREIRLRFLDCFGGVVFDRL